MKRDDSGFQDYHNAQARKSFQTTWQIIAWAHGINATLSLLVTSLTVYYYIHHPLIGTISEIHAVIV